MKKGRKRILIVDDMTVFAESLRKVFVLEDFEVEIAKTGRQALERISSRTYDAILLDIILPDIKGTEVLRAIQSVGRTSSKFPNTLKIVLTGYATQENAMECLNLGADVFLLKPISVEGLLETVKGKLMTQPSK